MLAGSTVLAQLGQGGDRATFVAVAGEGHFDLREVVARTHLDVPTPGPRSCAEAAASDFRRSMPRLTAGASTSAACTTTTAGGRAPGNARRILLCSCAPPSAGAAGRRSPISRAVPCSASVRRTAAARQSRITAAAGWRRAGRSASAHAREPCRWPFQRASRVRLGRAGAPVAAAGRANAGRARQHHQDGRREHRHDAPVDAVTELAQEAGSTVTRPIIVTNTTIIAPTPIEAKILSAGDQHPGHRDQHGPRPRSARRDRSSPPRAQSASSGGRPRRSSRSRFR